MWRSRRRTSASGNTLCRARAWGRPAATTPGAALCRAPSRGPAPAAPQIRRQQRRWPGKRPPLQRRSLGSAAAAAPLAATHPHTGYVNSTGPGCGGSALKKVSRGSSRDSTACAILRSGGGGSAGRVCVCVWWWQWWEGGGRGRLQRGRSGSGSNSAQAQTRWKDAAAGSKGVGPGADVRRQPRRAGRRGRAGRSPEGAVAQATVRGIHQLLPLALQPALELWVRVSAEHWVRGRHGSLELALWGRDGRKPMRLAAACWQRCPSTSAPAAASGRQRPPARAAPAVPLQPPSCWTALPCSLTHRDTWSPSRWARSSMFRPERQSASALCCALAVPPSGGSASHSQ